MREILFRGKDKSGNWIEGDLLQYLGYGKVHIAQNYTGAGCREVVPETVGQFTGLKGKNGKKIFEGDLCLCDRNISDRFDKTVFEIVFDPYRGFYGENFNEIEASDFFMCEVIGNIHDNPELIGGDENG